jgi:DNA-directed RNA polymerase subunit RPC12/RpoP
MLVRQFKCPSCGASRDSLEESITVVCAYCGTIIAIDSSGGYRGHGFAETVRRSNETFLDPTAADVRKMQLAGEMHQAHTAGDRERWRLLASEYYALLAVTDPHMVPAHVKQQEDFRQWYREAVECGEIMMFDPEVRALFERVTALAQALVTDGGDRVASIEEMVAAGTAYYRLLKEHPDLPRGVLSGPPDHHGRQLVRTMLASMEATLGPGEAARIYREVFGEAALDSEARNTCTNCGAPLDTDQVEGGYLTCPFCDAVIQLSGDPWIESTLAMWEAQLDDLGKRGVLDGQEAAMAVLSLTMLPFHTGGRPPDPDTAYTFLVLAVPWLEASILGEAIGLLLSGHGDTPELKRFLKALQAKLGEWVPDPSRRPDPEAATTGAAGGQWADMQAALWKQSPRTTNLEESLIGMCLMPFYQGSSVTAAQALDFFGKTGERTSKRKLREAADQILAGYRHATEDPVMQRICGFLQSLLRAL